MDSNSFFLISVTLVFLVIFLKFLTVNEKGLFYLILLVLSFHLVFLFFMQLDLNRFYNLDVVHYAKSFTDGEAYSSNALIISNTLRGKVTDKSFFYTTPGIALVSGEVFQTAQRQEIVKPSAYEVGYITYLYAVIYAAYGYAPAFLNFINILLNIFTALIIFSISKKYFNRVTAYIATTLFLFWPTVFYYSTSKTKEPWIIFLSYLLLFLGYRAKDKKDLIALALATVPILGLIGGIRERGFLPLLLVILLYLWLRAVYPNQALRRLSIFLIMFAMVIKWPLIYSLLVNTLRGCASQHWGFVTSGGFQYSLLTSQNAYLDYNLFGWLYYLVRGWYHLIFEPLFSSGYSALLVMFYSFKLIFILFFLFAIFGLIINLRLNRKNNFLLISFFLVQGSAFAMIEGNTGTMLRHRDLIVPVVFIYGAYFVSKILPQINFRTAE